MNLTIVSAHQKQIITISWIEVETATGNFVIQPNHAPMLLAVTADQPITFCSLNGRKETFSSRGGILVIERTNITLLLRE